MRIAIVVHGRFHGFELAAALQRLGHRVSVYTNYPVAEARRFGLAAASVRTRVINRVAMRVLGRLGGALDASRRDRLLHDDFGRWAARRVLADGPFDVVHCFSGVAEPVFERLRGRAGMLSLVRGSAHIDRQHALLAAEAARTGAPVELPTPWMRERERREYEAADRVLVLSRFAADSFLQEGFDPARLRLAPCGVDVGLFRAPETAFEARRARLRARAPLRALYVGALSTQKGADALLHAAKSLQRRMALTIVGDLEPHWRAQAALLDGGIRVLGRVPQHRLPALYESADVFLHPSVQDGFAMVIPQALAAGLAVVASRHSAAPDLIAHGESGLLVDAGDPEALVAAIRRLDEDRGLAVALASAAATRDVPDWRAAAEGWLAAHDALRGAA
jgi:glycosyltransferase involved in cell wall biosynthesis